MTKDYFLEMIGSCKLLVGICDGLKGTGLHWLIYLHTYTPVGKLEGLESVALLEVMCHWD